MDNLVDLDANERLSQHGMLDDGCHGSSINHPVMIMGYDPRKLEVVMHILRPLVRSLWQWNTDHQALKENLRDVDDVIRTVFEDLEKPPGDATALNCVSFNFNYIANKMDGILSHCAEILCYFSMSTWKGAEHTVRFVDSLIQIFQDICDHEAESIDAFVSAKKEMLEFCEELEFVENFFWLINVNPTKANLATCSEFSYVIEKIGVEISCTLYNCLMYRRDDAELVSCLKAKIYALQKEVKDYYNNMYRNKWLAISAPKLDERVVCFFDFLIEEIRKLLSYEKDSFMVAADVDEIETLVHELSFVRCRLLDVLVLFIQEQEALLREEMISLCVSAQSLIMDTGFLIYFFRVDGEKERTKESDKYFDLHFSDSLEAVESPEREAIYFSQIEKKEDEKERGNYWRFRLPGLLEHVEILKQEANDIFSIGNQLFSSCRQSCCSMNKMVSPSFLMEKLGKLMLPGAASTGPLNNQIKTIYQEASSLGNCLAELMSNEQFVKSQSQTEFQWQQLEEARNKFSFIIDLISTRKGPLWYHKLGIFAVENHMKVIQRQMKAHSKKMVACDTILQSVSGPVSQLDENHIQDVSEVSSKDEIMDMNMEESPDKLVGIKDAVMEVTELLTSFGATLLKTISIVGMPGLGKTTLANSVYKHPSITMQFHVRAWCCASQSYVKEALLLEILSQIVEKVNESHDIIKDLDLEVYQNLKGRKYLIVIDDIWDTDLWNDLKGTFPDDQNGSRILFTTRNRSVALKINSIPYSLRLLSNKESCELLLLQVFDGENCPEELALISDRIARNCQGLPLAVILIAGILKRIERRKGSWEQVAKTVFSLHTEQAKYCEIMDFTNILEFSYQHLPDRLKPCFYYFGAFPEDTSISVSKLTRLWISEDFVHGLNLGLEGLKQEAQAYLHELIDRSLVMISKRSSKGGVKACRVHDVLRQFCSKKLHLEMNVLEEDAFAACSSFRANINVHNTTYLYHYRSYPATVSRRFRFQDISSGLHFCLRLRRHTDMKLSQEGPYDARRGLSEGLLVMRTRTTRSKQFNYDLISCFLQLRVLDLANVRVESSADTTDLVMIFELVHLRYLAIRPRVNEMPKELGNLQYLETFALSGVIGNIILPESIWNLASLRYLLSDHGIFVFPHFTDHSYDYFSHLENLISISSIPLRRGNNVENLILRRLIGIQKLGCRLFSDLWDNSTRCSIFPELGFLNELKSLKISFSGKVLCPFRFSFPSSLTKLSMSNSRLSWDEISLIGKLLPNLEVLKLMSKAFEGKQWDMGEGEFPKLKFLKLESLDIEVWNADAPDDLPYLEQLVVLHCPKLLEIPSSLGEIATLKSIEMKWCSSPAMDSVKKVAEYQRDMSNDELGINLSSPLE